ncbi:MAG: Holliday junction branch migration protein RuvA [Ruminiclostridium sp.]
MIYSVRGKLIHTEQNLAVVECGGVGYACRTTAYTLSPLKTGEDVTLFTYMNVREDAVELFGFGDKTELNCFKMLLTVSGVGPKAALSILSDLSPQAFALCVAGGDSKLLTRSQGIGKKIADRIVLELKDKLSGQLDTISSDTYTELSATNIPVGNNANEALSALVVLGFSTQQAQKALSGLPSDMSVSEMVKEGLKKISSL